MHSNLILYLFLAQYKEKIKRQKTNRNTFKGSTGRGKERNKEKKPMAYMLQCTLT